MFNENEITVLRSLANQMKECTGGEFGYIEDTERGNLSKHQFAGYIADLKKKDVFEYFIDNSQDDGVDCDAVQFALKEEIYNKYVS